MRNVLMALGLTSLVSGAWPARLPVVPAQQALDGRVLAVAWVDDGRLLVLAPQRVFLLRLDGERQGEVASTPLPEPFVPVRSEAGMIALAEESHDAWILTNGMTRAVLIGIEQERLVLRATADAVPWPGLPGGIRYQEGTNVLLGVLPEGSPQRIIAMAPGRADLAVSDRGELLDLAGDSVRAIEGLRVGPALAWLGPEDLVAASAQAPGERDELFVLHHEGGEWTVRQRLSVPGAARSVATSLGTNRARVACVCVMPGGADWRLLVFDTGRETGP